MLTFKVPAEDRRGFTDHTVGHKPPGTISAQLQNRRLRLLGEMGQELGFDLTLSLKGIKGFWMHGGRKEGFSEDRMSLCKA